MQKSIIDAIACGEINEWDGKYERTKEDEEAEKAMDALENTFSEEQKRLFERYFETTMAIAAKQESYYYARGFKTGVWLGLEISDFKIS